MWWPLDTFAASPGDARDVRIDRRVGGTIREVSTNGVEHLWGTITVYDEGERFEATWHPSAPKDDATRVDLRFVAADGGTRITLVHSGWKVLGERGQAVRDNYESGWDEVLRLSSSSQLVNELLRWHADKTVAGASRTL